MITNKNKEYLNSKADTRKKHSKRKCPYINIYKVNDNSNGGDDHDDKNDNKGTENSSMDVKSVNIQKKEEDEKKDVDVSNLLDFSNIVIFEKGEINFILEIEIRFWYEEILPLSKIKREKTNLNKNQLHGDEKINPANVGNITAVIVVRFLLFLLPIMAMFQGTRYHNTHHFRKIPSPSLAAIFFNFKVS